MPAIALFVVVSLSQPPNMQDHVRRFFADRESVQGFYRLPFSDLCHEKYAKFLDQEIRSLETVKFESLDVASRVDYIALSRFISSEKSKQSERQSKEALLLRDISIERQSP
ncbi:MAG: hypothetical protein JNM34_06495 [Chthonomonadaceae bacterium]|nr:hypothetical protein [Chthonomonadaceae bacterium]